MEVSDYIDKLDLLIRNYDNKIESIVYQNKEQIIDLNRENQLFEMGIDSNGKSLLQYREATISIKILKKQPIDRTTLFDTGEFYKGFFIKFNTSNYTLEIWSSDKKTTKLIEKYGKDIFGLIPKNIEYLDEKIIKKHLDEWVLRYL